MIFAVLLVAAYCEEQPSRATSLSVGSPSHGSLEGGVALAPSAAVRVLPRRHAARCLHFGVERLVRAISAAGERVARTHRGSPPLGVGDIARARGGPIREFSRSHQAGRDADLAYYMHDAGGLPIPAEDLTAVGDAIDVERTWTLCRALLEDPSIDVRWMFVSNAIREMLLREARRTHAPNATIARAEAALHQPSDAPPHDDHLHLRIRCTAQERTRGCRD